MKNLILILFILFQVNSIFGQDFGKVETINIYSKELNQNREFFIYTPSYYKEQIHQFYDVIYVFDAQRKEYFDLVCSLLPFTSKEVDNPYIVVGITSTYDEKLNYDRNDDLLPKPKNVPQNKFYGHANRANFLKYFENELVPYIENNYRVAFKKILVGHSLSASFVISAFIKNPNFIDAIIAISPNLLYDKERIANELLEIKTEELNSPKFLYSSYVNEDNGWVSSNLARKKINDILNIKFLNEIKIVTDSIPNKNHFTTFVPSIINGLTSYFGFLEKLPIKTYRTTIEVEVPNEKDEVYITGNQDVLGSWKEDKVKMKRISKLKRNITLELKSKTRIRFTRGSSETEAILKNYDLQYLYDIPISPSHSDKFSFQIINWIDKIQNN